MRQNDLCGIRHTVYFFSFTLEALQILPQALAILVWLGWIWADGMIKNKLGENLQGFSSQTKNINSVLNTSKITLSPGFKYDQNKTPSNTTYILYSFHIIYWNEYHHNCQWAKIWKKVKFREATLFSSKVKINVFWNLQMECPRRSTA